MRQVRSLIGLGQLSVVSAALAIAGCDDGACHIHYSYHPGSREDFAHALPRGERDFASSGEAGSGGIAGNTGTAGVPAAAGAPASAAGSTGREGSTAAQAGVTGDG